MFKISLCLLILLVSANLSANAFGSEKVFKLGFAPLYPFIWEDEKGQTQGLYVDVLREALTKRLNYQLEFSKYPYRRLLQNLDKGVIDAYINIGNTTTDFSSGVIPIAVGMISVFTYKDHPKFKEISDIDFLDDVKDFDILSHVGDQWAIDNLKQFNLDTSAINYSQVFRKLAKKRGDIALVHEMIGVNTIYAEKLADKILLASRLTTNPVLHRLLISKSVQQDVINRLDQTFVEMLNDGSTISIYKQYKEKYGLQLDGVIEENKVRIAHYAGSAVGSVLQQIVDLHNKKTGPKTPRVKSLFLDLVPYKDTIKYTLLGPNPPELFMTWAGYRTQYFVDNNLIQPLGISSDSLNQFDSYSIASVTYANKVYALPWSQHAIALLYNKNVLSQYGLKVPETFEQTIHTCKVLQKNKIVPFALGSKNKWPAQFWFDYLMLRMHGDTFRKQFLTGKIAITDARVKQIFAQWRRLLDGGCISADNTDQDFIQALEFVSTGKAAMTLMGTWAAGTMVHQHKLKFGVDFDIAPFPTFSKDIPDYLLSVQDVLVRTKNTRDEKVEPVLEYFSSPEVQLMYSNASGSPAPNYTINKNSYPKMQQRMLELLNRYPHDMTTLDLSLPPLKAEILMALLKDFLLKPESIDALLLNAEQQLKRVGDTNTY